jgi:hypothetical protein
MPFDGVRLRSSVRRVYLDRLEDTRVVDSLDVPFLHELANSLGVPTERWPAVDLVARVFASETMPRPGSDVRFTIDVVNRGTRPVQRARITLRLQREGGGEILWDWFRDVGAGQTVRVEFTATLPAGRATAVVTVRPPDTAGTFRAARPWRDPAVTIVGDSTWRRQ